MNSPEPSVLRHPSTIFSKTVQSQLSRRVPLENNKTKIYKNVLAKIIKIAATPIYGKNRQNVFPKTQMRSLTLI